MKALKEKQVAVRPQKEVCAAIGSIVVGLYFLSSEAKKDNIDGLAPILDEAILRAVTLGSGMYHDRLKSEFESNLNALVEDACLFIDSYCALADTGKKRELAGIVKSVQKYDGDIERKQKRR